MSPFSEIHSFKSSDTEVIFIFFSLHIFLISLLKELLQINKAQKINNTVTWICLARDSNMFLNNYDTFYLIGLFQHAHNQRLQLQYQLHKI